MMFFMSPSPGKGKGSKPVDSDNCRVWLALEPMLKKQFKRRVKDNCSMS